jgi:serine/threonine-protein kinase
MVHIEGSTIEQAAAERPIALSDAMAVVRDAAAILAHAHRRGVVHRAITPKSIVRTPGRGFAICITDWGDASINDGGNDGASAHPVQSFTRFYRAPELAVDGRADTRADIYSLGAVMFEAATLVLPEPVQKFPGVPEPFHQLLAGMLARFPEDRPTAEEVAAEAGRLVEVFSDADGQIEEVEVELVDIANSPAAMPNLGWMPPDRLTKTGQTLGALRRRRDP